MAYDADNIFARILRGEMNAHVVLDDMHCMAFMDVMPQSLGHTLVLPREPAENLFELSPEGLSHVAAATRRVAQAVRVAFDPGGVMVMQLNGADAGQTVFHIHFHIIPRYPGEEMKRHARSMADARQLEEQAARIRAALNAQPTRSEIPP